MLKFKNWKEYINQILINSGQFQKIKTEIKNETEIETYKSNKEKSKTEIQIGYLKGNLLIYLHILNPNVPGHNRYVKNEYFYKSDFNKNEDYGNPALEFNEKNRKGILSILKNGLKGKEIQFIKNGKVLKSNLFISETQPNFKYLYDFTNRSFWKRIFEKKIEDINGIEKREIQLKTIFEGIKNELKN